MRSLALSKCQGISVVVLSFLGLVGVRIGVGVVYYMARARGAYAFHPASALVLAEAMKCIMSVVSLCVWNTSGLKPVYDIVKRHSVLARIVLLAALYAFNNLLAFQLALVVDPGTMSLMKTGSTLISALLLRLWIGKRYSGIQWIAITLQMLGMCVTQYDPFTGQTMMGSWVYLLLFFSVCITSVASVINGRLISDNADVSLSALNAILYAVGTVCNMMYYTMTATTGPSGQTMPHVSFFSGYDNVWSCLVILCNALIGLAITLVYKHAGIMVKTFATASATVSLYAISTLLDWIRYDMPMVVMGASIVFLSSYLFIIQTPQTSDDKSQLDRSDKREDKGDV